MYQAVCNLCERDGIKAEYTGETGDSAYTRGLQHLSAVKNDQPSQSALAKHLREFHPNNIKDTQAFKTRVIKTFTDGVIIHNSDADILINDKEEWVQPAVVRMQSTREPGGGIQSARRTGRGTN